MTKQNNWHLFIMQINVYSAPFYPESTHHNNRKVDEDSKCPS